MKSNCRMTARRLFVLAACWFFMAPLAKAQTADVRSDARVPTVAEMRLLPPYCPDTQIISRVYGRQQAPSNYDAHTKIYVDLYGADFWHLHHYCFGLVDVVRSHRIFDRKEREGRLRKSIGEFDYVLRAIRPDSILRPELHVKRGQSLVLMGRGGEAVGDFRKAIAIKPDYSPAYASLSDYYKESGKKDLALKTLEEGLALSGGDRSLLRRYASLGGTKTFAPPADAEAATAPVAAESVTESAPTQAMQEQADKPADPAAAEPVTESAKTSPSGDAVPPPVQPIGNSTNPYCRFCP